MFEVRGGRSGQHPAQRRSLGGTAAAHGLVGRVEQAVGDRPYQRQRAGREYVPPAGAVGPDRCGGDLQRAAVGLGRHGPRNGRAGCGHGAADHRDRQRRHPQTPGHRDQPRQCKRHRADLAQGEHGGQNRHRGGAEEGLAGRAVHRRRNQ